MVESKVRITNKLGLHLRAAALLVQTASGFECDIRVRKGDIDVDAKSIMGVLGLEAPIGSELTVRAKGPDEEAGLAAVIGLIQAKFSEPE